METFAVKYVEGGTYTAKGVVTVEAETKEAALKLVENMGKAGEIGNLNFDYERIDCETY